MSYIILYKVERRVGNRSGKVEWLVKAKPFQTFTIHKTRKEAIAVCKQENDSFNKVNQ